MAAHLSCTANAHAGERFGLSHPCGAPAVTLVNGAPVCAAHGGAPVTSLPVRLAARARRLDRNAAGFMAEARHFRDLGVPGLVRSSVRMARRCALEARAVRRALEAAQ